MKIDNARMVRDRDSRYEARTRQDHCLVLQITTQALRSIARRTRALEIEAAECEKELVWLVSELAPALLEQPGIGPI